MKLKIIRGNILTAIFYLIFIFVGCLNKAEAINGAQGHSYTEVTYHSDGVIISAALWLPEKKGPHPAIVMVHGSGPSTKEGGRRMARHFVKMGFAVLTHDKRGVGKSGGVYVERNNTSLNNLNLLARDISAGINYLKTRSEIDAFQIGLYGWSQAGWISPIVASLQDDLAFSILISGPTVTTGEENYYSALTGDGSKSSGLTREQMSQKIKEKGPHGFDPYPYLKNMNIPALWLLGDSDKSIPIPETVANLDRLINEDRKNFIYQIFDKASHGLRVNGRLVDGYWDVQEEFLFNQVKVVVP